jgi:lysozyme
MDELSLKRWIKKDEALRTHPYLDSTGHVTIGWGRNLENGISEEEANILFENDYKRTVHELNHYSWFVQAPNNVQNALINMNFNLGIEKLLEFHDMIHFLSNKDYLQAGQAALNSLWAKQVHSRANEIEHLMSYNVQPIL